MQIIKTIKYNTTIMYYIHNFIDCCKNGNFKLAKKYFNLIKQRYERKYDENGLLNMTGSFDFACENGQLTIAKWILKKILPLIDIIKYISYCDEYTFTFICKKGLLKVAKWLLKIKPNINIIKLSLDGHNAFFNLIINKQNKIKQLILQHHSQKYFMTKMFHQNKIYTKKQQIAKN